MNVDERVRAYYAALSAGDVEAVLAMFAPEGEMRDPVGAPPAGDDMQRRQRYAGIGAAFSSFTIEPETVIAGGDEAAATWTARATTKQEGRDVTFSGISVFMFDGDGRIARMSAYWDPAAIAARMRG
jgi:steroid delta-isomerase-like uncharacterized protein